MAGRQTGPRSAYREKLLDVRWQKRRLEILSRDEFICQSCCDSEETAKEEERLLTLHVHHLWYEGEDPWDAPDEALVTLCSECHEEETKHSAEQQQLLIRALQSRGWLSAHFNEFACAIHNHPPLHGVPDVQSTILSVIYRIPKLREAVVTLYWDWLRERSERKLGKRT